MATTTAPAALDRPLRSASAAGRAAFGALLLRDLQVLRKTLKEFLPRTILQPFLLVFVFLYVFPAIGQGIGGGAGGGEGQSAFATVLVAGVVGISIMFQGIQAVAMQLAQEFGFTREIEDRVQAPCPIWLVAVAKVLTGAAQGVLAEVDELTTVVGVPVEMYDERMTSAAALKILRATGYNSRKSRGQVDKHAAAIMLQGWIDAHE